MPEKSRPKSRRRPAAIAAGRGRNSVHDTRSGERSEAGDRAFEAVGALFRSAREMQRLSQYQVAALSEGRLSRTTISDIERGRSLPGLENLVCLSRILHLDPADVLERVELDPAAPVDVTDVSFDDLLGRAKDRFWAADYRGALAIYEAAAERLVLAPPDDATELRRLRARIEINRAVTLRRCSALKAAETAAKRATELSADMPELQAQAYMVLASLHSHEGLQGLAEWAADKAVALSEPCEPLLRGRAWNQRGDVLHRQGRFEEARQAFLLARKHALKAKDHTHMVKIEGNLGSCLFSLRRHVQARGKFTKAIELARKHADPAAEASWLVALGRLAFTTGELDEANRMAAAALDIARPHEHSLTCFRAEWLRHLVTRARTKHDRDERRLAYLRKLYPRVSDQKAILAVAEFKAQVLENGAGQEKTP